jgi:hypothetical protein
MAVQGCYWAPALASLSLSQTTRSHIYAAQQSLVGLQTWFMLSYPPCRIRRVRSPEVCVNHICA